MVNVHHSSPLFLHSVKLHLAFYYIGCAFLVDNLWFCVVFFLIHSDNLSILIVIFRTLMFQVIIRIAGLISTIFATFFFFLLCSYFCLPYIFTFCDLNGIFYMIPFSFISKHINYISFYLLILFFIGDPGVCNIHLQVIQVCFQMSPYYFTGSENAL